jgi:hypothetical protein
VSTFTVANEQAAAEIVAKASRLVRYRELRDWRDQVDAILWRLEDLQILNADGAFPKKRTPYEIRNALAALCGFAGLDNEERHADVVYSMDLCYSIQQRLQMRMVHLRSQITGVETPYIVEEEEVSYVDRQPA